MSDICKCENKDCPAHEKCHRFTAHANELWQSYGNFTWEKGGCPFFIDNRDWRKSELKQTN